VHVIPHGVPVVPRESCDGLEATGVNKSGRRINVKLFVD
jgi:hypothetical protein